MSLLISDRWAPGQGPVFASHDPATQGMVWQGGAATTAQVNAAVAAARAAGPAWQRRTFRERLVIAQGFAAELDAHRQELAALISREVGKPRWESLTEVASMVNKVAISAAAYETRTGESEDRLADAVAQVRHRPHGVMAVFGPYNFPGHLPNGHLVPALLAGNTVVFKPSEAAPAVGEWVVRAWQRAGLPNGVLNLVQGGRAVGVALSHAPIDGLLFTGSYPTGVQLHRQFAGRPEVMLALELGGNNPLVAWGVADLDAAALLVVQSAYLSAGQRCTCARRLIVDQHQGAPLVTRLLAWLDGLHIAPWDAEPPPFYGPVVHQAAATRLLAQQQRWLDAGAVPLRPMNRVFGDDRPFLSPGLLDITNAQPDADLADEEIFGPLLLVQRVPTFEAAIATANRTRFGLSAGLLADNPDLWAQFLAEIRAGVVNWNRPLTGASSRAPFGGVGASGNHRPSAYYAADYCAYPLASLIAERATVPATLPLGLTPPPDAAPEIAP